MKGSFVSQHWAATVLTEGSRGHIRKTLIKRLGHTWLTNYRTNTTWTVTQWVSFRGRHRRQGAENSWQCFDDCQMIDDGIVCVCYRGNILLTIESWPFRMLVVAQHGAKSHTRCCQSVNKCNLRQLQWFLWLPGQWLVGHLSFSLIHWVTLNHFPEYASLKNAWKVPVTFHFKMNATSKVWSGKHVLVLNLLQA